MGIYVLSCVNQSANAEVIAAFYSYKTAYDTMCKNVNEEIGMYPDDEAYSIDIDPMTTKVMLPNNCYTEYFIDEVTVEQ